MILILQSARPFLRFECRPQQRKREAREDFTQDHFEWEKRAFDHLLLALCYLSVKTGDLQKGFLARTVFLHSPSLLNIMWPENKVKICMYFHALFSMLADVDYCLGPSLCPSLKHKHTW